MSRTWKALLRGAVFGLCVAVAAETARFVFDDTRAWDQALFSLWLLPFGAFAAYLGHRRNEAHEESGTSSF